MSRELSIGELRVLRVIQSHYGPQNTAKDVMMDDDDAVLWVKDQSGETVVVSNLTNLSDWLEDGTIQGESDLLENWLTR